MEEFRDVPTRSQQSLAAVLGVVGAAISGLAAYFFAVIGRVYIGAALFGVLFLGCAWVSYRAMGSAPRAFSTRERNGVGLMFYVVGVVALAASLFAPDLRHKLLLLAPGMSCLAYGLAARRR